MNFSNSYFSSYMDWFHGFNSTLVIGVLFFVTLVFYYLIVNNFTFKSKKVEYQWGELFCSVFPTLILMVQMIPSLSLLYYYGLMNMGSLVTIKVTGHQWYWSYEIGNIGGLEFDSYMKSLDQLNYGEPRLLEVDNRCVIPQDTNIRFCITSADVIHAWALSNLSIKLDAMSGMLSILNYSFPIIGVFYGQCSEICGANHSFMPIALEVTLFDFFKFWCMSLME